MALDDVRVLTRADSAALVQDMQAFLSVIDQHIMLLPDAQYEESRSALQAAWSTARQQHQLLLEREQAMHDAARMLDAASITVERLRQQRDRLLAQVEGLTDVLDEMGDPTGPVMDHATDALGEEMDQTLGLPAGTGSVIIDLLTGNDLNGALTPVQREALGVWLRMVGLPPPASP